MIINTLIGNEKQQESFYMYMMQSGMKYIHIRLWFIKQEDVVWLPMRQLSTRDQMKQILTTKGHITAFNNEQGPYRRVSYEMPRNDKFKTIQTRKLAA